MPKKRKAGTDGAAPAKTRAPPKDLRDDPLLSGSPALPESFATLEDNYSCHSTFDNPRHLLELFHVCRTLYKMMTVHRGFVPSSDRGQALYRLFHAHAYTGPGLIALLYQDFAAFCHQETLSNKKKSFQSSKSKPSVSRLERSLVCTMVVQCVRVLQKEVWVPTTLREVPATRFSLHTSSTGIKLLFLLHKKVGVAKIRHLISKCKKLAPICHFLVIHHGKLTVGCYNELNDFYRAFPTIRVEHHLWDTMLVYPYDLRVPIHRLVPAEERTRYLKEHAIEQHKLMPLHVNDPMVLFHGFQAEDTVEVIFREPTGHSIQLFRVVRNQQDGLEGTEDPEAGEGKEDGQGPGVTASADPGPTSGSHGKTIQPLSTKPIHVLPANQKKMKMKPLRKV